MNQFEGYSEAPPELNDDSGNIRKDRGTFMSEEGVDSCYGFSPRWTFPKPRYLILSRCMGFLRLLKLSAISLSENIAETLSERTGLS